MNLHIYVGMRSRTSDEEAIRQALGHVVRRSARVHPARRIRSLPAPQAR